jgi:hypothetical protein
VYIYFFLKKGALSDWEITKGGLETAADVAFPDILIRITHYFKEDELKNSQ